MTSTITKLPQADTQFASGRAAAIFADYFQAKSSGNADQFVTRYAPQTGSHSDAVLGLHSPDWDSTSAMFHAVMPNWNGGTLLRHPYPRRRHQRRGLRDRQSGVVRQ